MEIIVASLGILIGLILLLFLVFNLVPLTEIMIAKATGKKIIPFESDPIDDQYQEGKISYLEMLELKKQRDFQNG